AALGAGDRVKADWSAARVHPAGAGGVVASAGAVRALSASRHLSSDVGALGDALHARGLRTASIGEVGAVAVMDRRGYVDFWIPRAAVARGPTEFDARALTDAVATNLLRANVVIVPLTGVPTPAADELLGRLRAIVDPATLVIVVAPAPLGTDWRLMPVGVAGGTSHAGGLWSPSTRRHALVTLADIAPTV